MRTRATLALLFGVVQSTLAFSIMALVAVLYLNLFDVQVVWNIPQEAMNFYLGILLAFSVFLIASGLFLINEWREIH